MSRKKRDGPEWIDPSILYSRQEIADRVGLSQDVLSFWIKRNLLIPEGASGGKGVHHKFHYSQLNIAVVLKAFRDHFGANIAKLKSLADALQDAVRLFRSVKTEIGAWNSATSLAESLARFRRGEPVKVSLYDDETGSFIEKIATSEAEVVSSELQISDHPAPAVIQLAEKLGPGHVTDKMIAAVMLGVPVEGSSYTGDYWLMSQTDSGWRITYDADDGTRDRSNVGPAVFLPIGPMLADLWKVPSHHLRWVMDRAAQMRAALKDAGFSQVEVIVDQSAKEPQVTWKLNGASANKVELALLPYFGSGRHRGQDEDRYSHIFADPSEYELRR
jgi:DNA-binding transcriptional MerR regulator